jgi:hypothetical protein
MNGGNESGGMRRTPKAGAITARPRSGRSLWSAAHSAAFELVEKGADALDRTSLGRQFAEDALFCYYSETIIGHAGFSVLEAIRGPLGLSGSRRIFVGRRPIDVIRVQYEGYSETSPDCRGVGD